MELHRFRSMGCEIVVGGGSPAELQGIEALFEERDAAFSRFRSGSELNRVNRAAGSVVPVSPLFRAMLGAALGAAEATEGLVDPTLGAALRAAGYTRDFAELEPDPRAAEPGIAGGWRSIRVAGLLLHVDAGVALDLNGVVKSLAVDEAVALLRAGFVSAGGDLASTGELDVALPGGGAVRLVRGALATSGSAGRNWLRGGEVQHHLIDPRTGRPSTSPWAYVTVAGATCFAADVAAKAAFLLGDDGPDWLQERRMPGRFLSTDGTIVSTRDWQAEEALVCI